ncbi:MAG: DUF362 domain-containing protein [Myxococcales bacterium]|jgi:uncharacterized protein (DUF362 family)|nr:DUF362 domain-containing protein [Myxococcales bacterium]MBL0196115.1 DUF362 domain-containing protein [Myxococcales bacterium]HQY62957.1 DUF362 domain-containing protein [Polyangiaceae bacterium]
MAKSKVAILRTSPRTVTEDYHRLMNLAGYQGVIDKSADTALKMNISWHFFYPGSSTTPWQMDGVVKAMLKDGYSKDLVHACNNRTVVIDAHLGERENKHIDVVNAHGLRNVHLYEGNEEWIDVRDAVGDLTKKFLCLNEVYPKGFSIPKRFIGENIIHLPTIKTHIFTTTTGAMKNAFGGLLNEHRHWTHPVIHETLVDLLMIQNKIHKGVFAVMDGTFVGDGPGPRCMIPHCKNVILASSDQVAIDALAGKLMGFDPLTDLKFVRLGHELGLGCGDVRDIEIVGDLDAAEENWNFEGPFKNMTFASKNQHRIYWGPLKGPIEWSLKTWVAPWAYLASVTYHDMFWYPRFAKEKIAPIIESDWGKLFANWGKVASDERGFPDVGEANLELVQIGVKHFLEGARLMGMSIAESPEIQARQRRAQLRSDHH